MDELGTRNIVLSDWASAIRVRNTSTSDRYLAIAAGDINLKFGSIAFDKGPKVLKLRPDQTVEFDPVTATQFFPRDPRVVILASARPFDVDQFA